MNSYFTNNEDLQNKNNLANFPCSICDNNMFSLELCEKCYIYYMKGTEIALLKLEVEKTINEYATRYLENE
jgi:hypothetical protein